jgi:hypothetical protein
MRTEVELVNKEKFLEFTKDFPSGISEIMITRAIFRDDKVFVDLIDVAVKPVLPKKKWYEFWRK